MSGFDFIMLLASLFTIASSGYWKVYGPAVLIVFSVVCCIYVFNGAFAHGVLLQNGVLFAWTILGIIYVFLSWMEWLPGRPVFYLREFVLRMGYFTFLIYPVTAAFYLLLNRARRADKLRLLAQLSILFMVCFALLYHFFPAYDGTWRVEGEESGFLTDISAVLNYGINNTAILFWWGLLFISMTSPARMVGIFSAMIVSDSAQMNGMAILVAMLWLWRNPESLVLPISAGIVIGFPLGALLMVLAAKYFIDIDPNMIHRAIWWMEALQALVENYGIGYGFGADSITDSIVDERFLGEGKWANLPIQVVHNEFVYVFYAMGVLGGILFLLFHFRSLCPNKLGDINMIRHAGLMFLMACLTTSVNTAMTSPAYLLGLCWIYGYLLDLNRHAKKHRA